MSEFVEVKTSELIGHALDWAVAEADGLRPYQHKGWFWVLDGKTNAPLPSFSTGWEHGGPLIELELIKIKPEWHHYPCSQSWEKKGYKEASGWHWFAYILSEGNLDGNHEQEGGTPLIAAMRCLVSYKLGDVVQVPASLTT